MKKRLRRRVPIGTAILFLVLGGLAAPAAGQAHRTQAIVPNDNREPAGRLEGAVRVVDLEIRPGRWFPEGPDGPDEGILAFAETSGPPQVPGPIVRVRAGERLRVSVRNRSGRPLYVRGLETRPALTAESLRLESGAVQTVAFEAGEPGTYYYWASGLPEPAEGVPADEMQLHGAFVVDPADAPQRPADRVFVLGVWFVPPDSAGPPPIVSRDQMTINGLSWPHTERFRFAVGDTVRWRWINPSVDAHPMHLHGFYYDVHTRGSWRADTAYAPAMRRKVVTELMFPEGTMAMTFVPTTPGNWLFHCHFAFHVSHFLSLNKVPDDEDPGAPNPNHGMRGLVLGFTVEDAGRPDPVPPAGGRTIRLHAVEGEGTYAPVSYAFTTEEPPEASPPAGLAPVGPPLILRKGEPVRIEIINHLRAPTAVHWHGMELERSWPDGVPEWSGRGKHVAPMIAPGDSFVAAFTPPRAGTFIYHSHLNEGFQIASGLFGPLIVEDPMRPFDPATERIVMIGGAGGDIERGRVNGSSEPAPIELEVGRTHRLRLVQMNPDWRVVTRLLEGEALLPWRPVAKDGADLPAALAIEGPAAWIAGPGETLDVEVTPRSPGAWTLEVATQLEGWRVELPIVVRQAPG